MYLPSHIAAGLVIGKITGDYTAAVIGSLIPDLDHLYSYFKHGAFKSWKKIIQTITSEEDPHDDQRNYFHNIFFFLAVVAFFMIINFSVGLIFSIAYFVHLLMDSLDGAEYYPLYPNKRINLRGPIGYFSKYDMAVSIVLIIIYVAI